MAKPVKGGWGKLIRLGGYLKGAQCAFGATSGKARGLHSQAVPIATGPVGEQLARAPAEGSSSWGTYLLKTWSRTQDSVTLSSAEAELVARSKHAAEVLGVRSMATEWEVVGGGCACDCTRTRQRR